MTVTDRKLVASGEVGKGTWALYDTGALHLTSGNTAIATGTHMSEAVVSPELREKLLKAIFELHELPLIGKPLPDPQILDKLVFDFHPQHLELLEEVFANEHFTPAEQALVFYSALKLRIPLSPKEVVCLAEKHLRLADLEPTYLPWGAIMGSWLTPEISALKPVRAKALSLLVMSELKPPRFKKPEEYLNFLQLYLFLEEGSATETLAQFCERSQPRLVEASLPRIYLNSIRLLAPDKHFKRLSSLTRDELMSIVPSYDSATEVALPFLVERAKRGEHCALVTRGYSSPKNFNKASKILTEDQCAVFSEHKSRFGRAYWENLGMAQNGVQVAVLTLVAARGAEETEEIINNLTKSTDHWAYLKLADMFKSSKKLTQFMTMALEENVEIPPVWATIVAGLEVES